MALVLARGRLTVPSRAGLFYLDLRLATQVLTDKIYTLRVPTDKIQSAPLLSTPHCTAHPRAAEQREIKDLSCLVVSTDQ